ncbi:MAG: peptide deformylase [Thermoanaerobaculia bacterium]
MAILPIRIYPDPVLRVRAEPISSFDSDLARLAENMVETMYAAPGIGLAAPQVGVSLRLAVVDLSVGKEPGELLVLVNPRLSEPRGEEVDEEGCLSIPEFTAKVSRPLEIRVSAFNLEGTALELEAEGMLARAICHEVDHLDGVLFVDHLRGLRRERARRFLKKLSQEKR